MNIIIVDDMERDRKMLRRMIQRNRREDKISETSNLSHMYAELAKSCDLLFLDISLNDNEKPDNEGLNALYDIIDSFPDLPICMVTGYYKEMIHKFLDEFLTKTTQIVNFLDKGSYDDDDLVKVFYAAEEYNMDIQKRTEDRLAADQLLDELAESERKRIQEQFSSDFENMQKRLNMLEPFEKAFEGNDWVSRIAAEAELTGGTCETNAALLCIELDRLSKQLCGNSLSNLNTFFQKAAYIIKNII
jgi:response regulator RpfG family c-di-GMP phosphodiesterase